MSFSKKHLVALIASFSFYIAAHAQMPPLQNGDLLFQDLDCGPLCDAIEEVTTGYQGHSFSHIGLVFIRHDSALVLEAIGKDVHLTPLATFVKRSNHKIYVGRVKGKYASVAANAVQIALGYIGIPYDDAFLYNNGKYYCSEMVYDAFKKANHNRPFFELSPMTFCPPGKTSFYPAWHEYYQKLGIPVPQGKPGINPGGISRSNKLQILK